MTKQGKKGFSLLELIIAVGIFSLMTALIAGIYIAFSNLQAQSRSSQRLLNDSQYALEMMAREIRNNVIFDFNPTPVDCNAYLGAGYNNCILLLTEEGLLTAFTAYDSALYHIILNCDSSYSTCQPWEAYPSSFTILLSPSANKILVDELDFYIRPQLDPYQGYSNDHPRVTIRLQTSYDSTRSIEQVSHSFQTTVSSRVYRR